MEIGVFIFMQIGVHVYVYGLLATLRIFYLFCFIIGNEASIPWKIAKKLKKEPDEINFTYYGRGNYVFIFEF